MDTRVNGTLNQTFSAFNCRRCHKEPVFETEDESIEEEEQNVYLLFTDTKEPTY